MEFWHACLGIWHIHAKTPRGTVGSEQLPNIFVYSIPVSYFLSSIKSLLVTE